MQKKNIGHTIEGIDRDKFPLELKTLPRALTAIGGSNKRMFRVDIGGNKFIALLPRPNYCLEKKVLFGDELVKLAKHQFSILCCYRSLGAPVPPAALYIFQLSTSIDGKSLPDPKRTYASACILMEDLTMEGLQVDEVNFTKIFVFYNRGCLEHPVSGYSIGVEVRTMN